jgi:hypothetical protein
MARSMERSSLRIQLDTKHCEVSADEVRKLEANLTPLRAMTQDFPLADLYVTISFHARTNDYHVKTSLVLTGRTLFTGEHDVMVHPAFARCVRKLIAKMREYLDSLGNKPEVGKLREGTKQELLPTAAPDVEQLDQAVHDGDYRAFRRAAYPYEEPVRRRLGRWIKRYPELEAQLGDRLTLADLLEEVFLNAFEQYASRPEQVRFGQWLEDLIDPSIRAMADDAEDEAQTVSFARTFQEMEQPPGATAPNDRE